MKYFYIVVYGFLYEIVLIEGKKKNHIVLLNGKAAFWTDKTKNDMFEQYAAMVRPIELNKYLDKFDASNCCPYCFKADCVCSVWDLSSEFKAK